MKRSQNIENFFLKKAKITPEAESNVRERWTEQQSSLSPVISTNEDNQDVVPFETSSPSTSCTTLGHPHDISQNPAEGPRQPHLKIFPRTVHGEKRRAFSKTWYSQHKWLEYSQSRDSVYCFACRYFSIPNASETPFTSHEGYSNWKKAMYKDGGFKGHEKSEGHTNAMYAWSEHQKNILTDSSVRDALDKAYKKKVEENRIYIKTVAEVVLLTAMQNLSQRGHLETDTSQNKGNFLELMELLSKHNPQAAGNAKYTSNTIQNEVIECLSEMVREDIIREVKESEYFSVIADETKDLKKTEQLSLVLRYYYNGAVQESFLEFQRASQLDAAGLTQNIIQCLERYGLEYRSNLVGQGYDGASVMAGKCRGVAARIKTEAKHAFYVHCNAHCLNLVIVDAKLYVYMSGSYVHQKWITVQKDMYPEAPRELQRLSDTRCKEDDKDKFKREVFYPILDHVHAEMEKRFNKTNCDIMRGIQALNPKSKSFLSEEIVVSLAGLYDCDIEDLKHELYQARKSWAPPLGGVSNQPAHLSAIKLPDFLDGIPLTLFSTCNA
ncbi:zinc finger MYM-type protein 1-like [Astatotilapia calliptera]|uniref:zinc finger MYM-type protein 1-like n=1 Tax=Astatotilapia calliptera TaxID=8154 RepID=UPI000E3FA5E0|nr:zinc finger MYM-type protein 1-like [Astatotilapia calliptera]